MAIPPPACLPGRPQAGALPAASNRFFHVRMHMHMCTADVRWRVPIVRVAGLLRHAARISTGGGNKHTALVINFLGVLVI